jgi:hypothetical protein
VDMHQLAQELRQLEYSTLWRKKESLPFTPPEWEKLVAYSDDEIIDAYIRCYNCGELYVPLDWVYTAIGLAPTAEEFISLTDGREGHYCHEEPDTDDDL